MANELTVTVSLKVANGSLVQQHAPGSQTFNQSTALSVGGVQPIGHTTHEALYIGADIANRGWCYMRNIDNNSHVSVGVLVSSTFYPLVHLEPGEATVFRMHPTAVPYAQAQSATVNLQYMIYAD
jgi:hypothetical protein